MNYLFKFFLLLVLTSTIGFAGYSWIMENRFERYSAISTTSGSNFTAHTLGIILLVAGVYLGSVYRHALALREKGQMKIQNFRRFFSDSIRSLDFVIGLAAAPIVYALIIQQTTNISLAGLSMIALQNGFVSSIVIGGITPTIGFERK